MGHEAEMMMVACEHAGDSSVKQANERTYMARLNASFSRYKQERMTHADSECRKMITTITQRLTQVWPLPHPRSRRTCALILLPVTDFGY